MYVIIGCLLLFMLIQSAMHHIERKDLYDRIMSKDFTEYKRGDTPKSPENIIKKRMREAHEKRMKT